MLSWRLWGIASTAVAVTTTITYLIVLAVQGTDTFWEIFPWAALMAAGAAASLTSALTTDRRIARRMAIGAGIVFAAIGVVALFSVGFGFLIAAVLSGVAASKAAPKPPTSPPPN